MRVDQSFGNKDKFNAIFFKNNLSQIYPHQGFPKEVAPTGYGDTVYRNNKGGNVDEVHQFSSSLVLDSRFGIIFHPFGLVYPDSSEYNVGALGITGTYPYSSFPGISSSSDNYAGLAAGSGGQVSEDTTGSLEEILTKVVGKNSLRIGFEGNLLRCNVQNPQSGFVGSSASTPGFVFDRRFTQMNSVNVGVGSQASSGDPIASLLLGYPSTVSYYISPAYALQQLYMAPFFQDDWRVTSKLTLNLGIRYDYESPLPTGSSLGLSTALGQSISFIDPNHVQPKSVQYSASVQQQLPGNVALKVACVGTRPTRLEVNHNINVLPSQYYNRGAAEVAFLNASVPNPFAGKIPQATNLNGTTVARNQLLVPFPEFGSVTEDYSSIGSAPYNSLQVQVSIPMRHNFSLQGNFTWDKIMLRNGFFSNGSGSGFDNASIASGHLYSVQDQNPTIIGNIFGIYQFPKFAKLPFIERLFLGGWQANAVFRDENGPLLSAPGNVNIIGTVSQPHPDKGPGHQHVLPGHQRQQGIRHLVTLLRRQLAKPGLSAAGGLHSPDE